MSLELLRFEGRAPVPRQLSPEASLPRETLRPRSTATKILTFPVAAATAGAQAIQLAGRRLWSKTNADAGDAVSVLSPRDAGSFIDGTGARIRKGVIYARHPKDARSHVVVPAATFHLHVIKEQIAEILRYLRSELHMSSVRITVKSEKTGKVLVGSTLKGVPIMARLGMKGDQSITLEQQSRQPKRVRSNEPYVWIDEFPQIKAAAQSARHGAFIATQSWDMSFGLSVQTAKLASISSDWISSFQFIVEAEYS